MFTTRIRFCLILGCVALAISAYLKGEYVIMIALLLAAGLFFYGYFKYQPIYTAFHELKKENFIKAELIISKIKYPEKLYKGHKGFYYFIKGVLAFQKKDWDESFSLLKKALNLGIRTSNNYAIVLLNLATIEYERKNYISAKAFLDRGYQSKPKTLVKDEMDKLRLNLDEVRKV